MKKEIFYGIVSGLSLILFYFFVMGFTSRSWSTTIAQFRQLWFWMILLSTGFGTQIGLFVHLRKIIDEQHKITGSKAITAASTTTSGTAMIACCAHHLTEILPIVGLSGLAVFFTQYQIPLIILGIGMNIFGIVYMLRQIFSRENND